ncbi:hypothetical protein N5D61_19535 [Pseudomonas sp. GD03842]|uniref:hypothetical protein n=1 Tax=Pseudomonas sp. GD03842 TaxID=2975385 RepID=UPI00244961C8|nr:hypothetical protein [Pseudomonas sp. GD03842]MDH0748519.1 hypothetical protein [Pseudomonas sp. GD03842]
MKTDPVNTPAAQSPGPNPNPMERSRHSEAERQADTFERVEGLDENDRETPPPQTWKHPDDGKSLSEKDEEIPLKP